MFLSNKSVNYHHICSSSGLCSLFAPGEPADAGGRDREADQTAAGARGWSEEEVMKEQQP